MKSILTAVYAKPLALYLIVALIALSTFAGPAEAMFMPAAQLDHAGSQTLSPNRAADLAKVQAALESSVVRQKLVDYGLSPEEALVRVNRLSDKELHDLATRTDALQAGGDAADAVVFLLVIVILVVVLVFLLDHRIEIRRR